MSFLVIGGGCAFMAVVALGVWFAMGHHKPKGGGGDEEGEGEDVCKPHSGVPASCGFPGDPVCGWRGAEGTVDSKAPPHRSPTAADSVT